MASYEYWVDLAQRTREQAEKSPPVIRDSLLELAQEYEVKAQAFLPPAAPTSDAAPAQQQQQIQPPPEEDPP